MRANQEKKLSTFYVICTKYFRLIGGFKSNKTSTDLIEMLCLVLCQSFSRMYNTVSSEKVRNKMVIKSAYFNHSSESC